MQDDLNILSSRITSLSLNLNVKKCEYIIVHLSNSSFTSPVLNIQGVLLYEVKEYKYLGIAQDDRLTFAKHTSRVDIKAKQIIGAHS
jgi:hypothetical protein